MRKLARDLLEAYSSPISTHVVGEEYELTGRFVGNSMFEGNDYGEFLRDVISED